MNLLNPRWKMYWTSSTKMRVKMKSINKAFLAVALILVGCSRETTGESELLLSFDGGNIITSITPFVNEGEVVTRANIAGDSFESGDLIKLRVICPYSTSTEYGESTWGGTYDNFRFFSWTANQAQWGSVGSGRGFDFNGDFSATSPASTFTMPQATPYVFTATTWSEELHFILSTAGTAGGNVILAFCSLFKADQREAKNYKSSDILWAQQFMQSGTDHIRLSFNHKMAALSIDISQLSSVLTGSEEVTVSLLNMPEIDQQDIAIGNYYAEKMKSKIAYGDYYRTRCSYEENGTVLGIAYPDETAGRLVRKTFVEVPQTAEYLAYKKDGNTFRLIIPPYTVPDGVTPTLLVRQGQHRWTAPLTLPSERTFESGKCYNVQMTNE